MNDQHDQRHTFETPDPIELQVELGSGTVHTEAGDTDRTEVSITGPRADEFDVGQHGRTIVVVAPRQRFGFGGSDHHDVRVRLPQDSDLTVKLGSADLVAAGRYGAARVKTGSGDVEIETSTGPTVVDSGSGEVRCDRVEGELRLKSGSGDVEIGEVLGKAGISTGSGDVTVGRAADKAVLKTGSGDLQVQRMESDLQLNAASGDMLVRHASRGRLTARTASGDVLVGIPDGTPVWTDVNTVTGSVSTDISGVGKPAEGQDHVEVRATSVSGDIRIHQV
jgi:DUF4097 and DUF4098 domain-containing protein YvlB